ncbi:MAG: ABC transporter permease [Candidatus Nanohalarchaeota archaeon]|nr:MAG: ABC transporter permease [Candidatus Nanohaloarchaeota archaeon]
MILMMEDYVKTAYRDIKNRKKRSWLTMIGIIIGVAAVVSLVSLGQGLKDGMNAEFDKMGAEIIMIMPGSGFQSMGSAGSSLTKDDVEVIKKVRGVNLAGGFLTKIAKVEFGNEMKYSWVSGLPLDESKEIIDNMDSHNIENGRDLKRGDTYKTMVGNTVANGDFFKKKVRAGDYVMINGKKFRVVGTLERIGNPDDDQAFMIPLETARDLFDEPDNLMVIMANIKPGFDASDVAENIKKAMRKDRDQEKGEEDFSVQTAEQLKETVASILNLVQAVLIGIAGISLLVGGIGIMNTMYTSVLERTRDIGVMKAIGARNVNIMWIFLIESGIIGMTGGAIGCAIGISISKSIEYLSSAQLGVNYLKASVAPELIIGALSFSFLVGMLSGTLPAMRAARLKPTDALRYE